MQKLTSNINWNPSLKKRWEASGFNVLHDMLKKKPDNVAILKMGDKTACLSWLVKGRCFSTCPCKDLHKQANGALLDATHKLLDACSVPASNGQPAGQQRRSHLSEWWDTP